MAVRVVAFLFSFEGKLKAQKLNVVKKEKKVQYNNQSTPTVNASRAAAFSYYQNYNSKQ